MVVVVGQGSGTHQVIQLKALLLSYSVASLETLYSYSEASLETLYSYSEASLETLYSYS